MSTVPSNYVRRYPNIPVGQCQWTGVVYSNKDHVIVLVDNVLPSLRKSDGMDK